MNSLRSVKEVARERRSGDLFRVGVVLWVVDEEASLFATLLKWLLMEVAHCLNLGDKAILEKTTKLHY